MSLPGGKIAARPLHFIWIADCSGSMSGDRIQALNHAVRESIPHMRTVAGENPNAEVLVRALKFSSGAEWHVAQPTPVEQFDWIDLTAGGTTAMGEAFLKVADILRIPPMDSRALPPVLVLISDGMPTDDYKTGLNELMARPWGKRAVRIAIAIGDPSFDFSVLKKFIGNPEVDPLLAKNSPQLVNYIRWASTSVLKAASAPMSQPAVDKPHVVPPPPPASADDDNTVW